MPEQKDPKAPLADQTPATAPEITDTALLSAAQKQRIDNELSTRPAPVAAPKQSPTPPAAAADTKAAPPTPPTAAAPAADTAETSKPQGHRLRRFFAGYWRRKAWTLPLTLLVIVGALAAVPYSRYALAAYVVKQPVTVTVTDEVTEKPVSSAEVRIDGRTFKTDKDGKALANDIAPGKHQLTVSKKYYKDDSQDIFVPLLEGKSQQVSIVATGRQVPISVTNKLTGKPLANVTFKASGTEVKTDKDGKATIVLPADKTSLLVALSNSGYNSLETKVEVTDQEVSANKFALVPAGKVYFLSRQSGKIDVVKTDLDGTNRQIVVYGTGKEDERGTVLLASRDWKYLALLSKRDSGLAKLYMIETATDKLSIMDEGDASFNLIGWSDHQFSYGITRNGVKEWESNRQAIKSFNADKRQLLALDQTQAEGDSSAYKGQNFDNFSLLADKLVYSVRWYGNSGFNAEGKQHSVREAAVNSQNKRDVKTFPTDQFEIQQFRLYKPGELYIGAFSRAESKYVFFEYESGVVKPATVEQDKFFSDVYPTYLVSPSGKQTFWSEQRDGRDTFFIGDAKGEAGKQIADLEEYQVYGWYSDDYVLAAKKGSELYILPATGGMAIKVTDYHKPQLSYRGYGGGYGGL